MESGAKEGESPVHENRFTLFVFTLSTVTNEDVAGIREDYTRKAKYFSRSIANKYREGKVKSRPVRPVK